MLIKDPWGIMTLSVGKCMVQLKDVPSIGTPFVVTDNELNIFGV